MANGAYIGIDGKARKVAGGYIGVGGVARKIAKAYVGVNGVAQLWWTAGGGPIVLEVEKITSDTYAGETTYTGEQFILLNIYPITNGTVSVTYGGLTKTVTDTSGAEEPNAQRVYFGTFNGVPDSVATPASGTLTIEGDCAAFGVGMYNTTSKAVGGCGCIKKVVEWGNADTYISSSAFRNCTALASIDLPDSIESIGTYAFHSCSALANIETSAASIGNYAFYRCSALATIALNEGVESIGEYAFAMSKRSGTSMRYGKIVFPSTLKTIGTDAFVTEESLDSQDGRHYPYLSEIRFLSETPPTMEADMNDIFGERIYFKKEDGSMGVIVVPKGCGDVYREAFGKTGWGSLVTEVE